MLFRSGINLDGLDENNPEDAQKLEDIAIKMNEDRRRLGVKYKNATPQELLDRIYKRNLDTSKI